MALLITALLMSLGFWQISRAQEKQLILEQQALLSGQESLTELPVLDSFESLRFRDVVLSGEIDSEHQFLLDNQVRNGKPGYSVLTPFQLSGGSWILIDRGWVEQGLSRQLLPDISLSAPMVEVRGVVYAPFGEPYSLGAFDSGAIGWPLVIQFLDFEGLSGTLGVDLLPATIRLSPQEPGGYLRDWITVPMGPQKHIGYAVQWFAMAAAFLILLGIVSRKRTDT